MDSHGMNYIYNPEIDPLIAVVQILKDSMSLKIVFQLAMIPSDYSGNQVEEKEQDVIEENGFENRPSVAAEEQIVAEEELPNMQQFGNTSRTEKETRKCQRCGHGLITCATRLNANSSECESCKKHFGSNKQLVVLIKRCNETKNHSHRNLNQDSKKFDRKADRIKKTSTDEKPYKCKFCPKTCLSLSAIRGHEKIHACSKRFKCEFCHRAFARRGTLVTHRRTHTGKPHKCNFCDRTFQRPSGRREHENVHTGVKPFKCEICQKAFPQSINLSQHKKIHSGEKPHKCNICNRAFRELSTRRNHERIHSDVKPFKCEICKRGFSQRGNLDAHMTTHTGEKTFKCNECDMRFNNSYQLKLHLVSMHSGDIPYQCIYCGKGFIYSSNLYSHYLTHTKEKPYSCNKCQLCFRQKGTLKNHLKACH